MVETSASPRQVVRDGREGASIRHLFRSRTGAAAENSPPMESDSAKDPQVNTATNDASGTVPAHDGSHEPATSHRPGKLIMWVEEVTVSFDGFKALNDLTLTLEQGELRCIIGPNGAGKTTLMDVMTGKTRPDSGAVYLENRLADLTTMSECEIAKLGVGRKFQRPTVFGGHTVYENCELALRGNKGVFHSLFRRLSKADRERIDEVLETVGLSDRRGEMAGLLAHGHKQWLEIGMLLAQEPKVLLVDEPVAGMNHAEMERTAALLNRLAGERTVVVVEHDMEFVRQIARKVTVLHEGSVLAEGPMDKIQNDPRVIEVYLGA
jgi:urea transport system ATP-binding protein